MGFAAFKTIAFFLEMLAIPNLMVAMPLKLITT